MGMISLPLMSPVPFSASCADDMTASIILETMNISPLWVDGRELGRIGNVGFWIRYMMPPARDRSLDFHRYDALDWAQRCISLAKYSILAAGCVVA